MKKPCNENIFELMYRGVCLGVAKALQAHKAAGRSIIAVRDGKLREIPPEEICIPVYRGMPKPQKRQP